MIVDSHHHFWRVERGDYHWMPASGVLARDYLPEDLRPLLGRAGVDRTVLVQAAQTEEETAFLLELADETVFVAGVVGWLDFEDEEFAAKLERLMRSPSSLACAPCCRTSPTMRTSSVPRSSTTCVISNRWISRSIS